MVQKQGWKLDNLIYNYDSSRPTDYTPSDDKFEQLMPPEKFKEIMK
jgi:hypothetical protein